MDPAQSPPQQPIQPPIQIPDFEPKPNYLKTIIFSVLFVLTLGLITYLIFQNQKLQKLVLNPLISPTVQIQSPTPKTVSSISITPDETAGWKTYTFNDWGVSIKAPFDPSQSKILYIGSKTHYDVLKIPLCPDSSAKTTCLTKKVEYIVLDNKQAKRFYVNEPKNNSLTQVIQTTEEPFGEISDSDSNMGAYIIFDQILSTFKFL